MAIGRESLHGVPLFRALSSSELEALARAAHECSYRTRAVIFQAGDPCTHLHLVHSGRVKIVQADATKIHILELLGAGSILDPTPLLDGGPHMVTARAVTPVVLIEVELAVAQAVMEHSPALRATALRLAAGQLRQYATHINDLAFKQVPARLAGVLLTYAGPDGAVAPGGDPLGRQFTKRDLAALVGTAREVVVRALKRLEEQGLISQRPDGIVILDRAGLERVRELK